MRKNGDMVTYSGRELAELRAKQGSLTDLARLEAKPETELERDIAGDPDWLSVPGDWHLAAQAVRPIRKTSLSLRLDNDVVDWFKQQGPGYQTRMNAVLQAFVKARQKAGS
jgi:uncharacterized protein (DUF4415 family)